MARHHIQNEFLFVEADNLGAELSSLKKFDTEYLWPGNPDTWNGRAPILFPIIGPLLGGEYQLNGKSYQMSQHGFARRSYWQLADAQSDFLLFRLEEDSESLFMYPFRFVLEAGYRIKANKLECSYRVVCKDFPKNAIDMPFSIGSHTAFRVPIVPKLELEGKEFTYDFDDYELEFEKEEDTVRYIQSDAGPLTGETVPFRTEQRKLPLRHSFFAAGSIIFKDLASTKITLQCTEQRDKPTPAQKATISFSGFPYCTLWTYLKRPEPYLCIEPWYGVTPTLGSSTDLSEREGSLLLRPREEFRCAFEITL